MTSQNVHMYGSEHNYCTVLIRTGTQNVALAYCGAACSTQMDNNIISAAPLQSKGSITASAEDFALLHFNIGVELIKN